MLELKVKYLVTTSSPGPVLPRKTTAHVLQERCLEMALCCVTACEEGVRD